MKVFFASRRFSLFTFSLFHFFIIFCSCSVPHQLSKSANKILLKDSVISTGHIGISIYEPATNTYWYNYNATKYFVPASNTKLFTLYAGMKYLGDSLVGLRYEEQWDSATMIQGTGDPTFLNEGFKLQPVLDFLKKKKNVFYFQNNGNNITPLGKGWAYDDYQEPYMAERNEFPIYGNCAKFFMQGDSLMVIPSAFNKSGVRGQNELIKNDKQLHFQFKGNATVFSFKIIRPFEDNAFETSYKPEGQSKFISQIIPFKTTHSPSSLFKFSFMELLEDTLHYSLGAISPSDSYKALPKLIHSQPTDSLFKPMMHNSDNFFAEQTLLMVSNERLGYMNDEDIIGIILKTDLHDVPQKPKWVDGSGLSRYNLFTPQSFVYILSKMQNEFGLVRLKNILPTGGEGTLKNYFHRDSAFIYAKTGSLSNNNSLSGFLITKKNKLLIFSILLNNFQGDAAGVKCAIQQFLEGIRNDY